MMDLGWLAELAKVLGGGAAGWLGRVLSERNKKRVMRRNLYRELGHNYVRVRNAIEDKSQDLMRRLPGNINTSYLQYALKNMDAYHEIHDYHIIAAFYKALEHISEAQTQSALDKAVEEYDKMYTGLAAIGDPTGKALVKFAPDFAHPKMVKAIMDMTGRTLEPPNLLEDQRDG